MSPCLAEDELLDLVGGRALPASAESHLADCPECAALLGALLSTAPSEKWGALAGRRLGPYRLEAQIGAGGMGEVYRAVDERLHRAVAVKVLTHAADLARRLETEARAAAAISHRNVVTVFDVGSEGDLGYVVQELVDGESLRSVLERGPVGAARARTLALGLASGLAAAHAQGVIHRDLKPENLLVTGDGTLKILDFGLAKLAGGSALEATEPGTVQGTIGYMAPEQARGEPADARSDLFSAGAIVFELCTGRRAFAGATHAQRLAALLRDTPPVDDPALGDLAPVVARCLEREPKRRFQSAQDLAWVLERGVPAPLIQRPRLTRRDFLGVALGGAAGLAAGRLLLPSTRAPARPTFGQLTYRNGRLMSARFTPDRSMVVYGAAWDGGPLTAFAVRTDGATTRPLDLPSADVLAISRRGEVAVSLGRRHVDSQMATGRLALVPLDGGAPRTLLDDVQEADFTPDGELALVRRVGLRFRLELPAGKVVHEVDGWLTHPRVSPDGKRIAVLLHPSVGDDRGDLLVLDRAGGRPRTLASGWSSIAGLAWDPEGDRLWFTASPAAANNALYSIAPAGGDPRLVIEVPGRLRLHDIAPGGLFAMTRDAWTLRTHVGKAGAEVDRSLSDFSLLTDLSPDGETLLLGELGDVEAVNGAYLVPTAGGKSLRVGAGLPLALSPDGTRVAALVWADPPRLVVYSTTSAEQPGLGVEPIRTITFARWIDATRLVVAGAAAGRAPRLWRLDTGGGSATPLTAEGHAGRTLELDPARRRLATIDVEGRLSVVDLATGATTVVPGDFRARRVCAWLGDDAVAIRNATTPIRVTRVELAGGVATPYLDIEPPAVGLKAVDVVLLHPNSGRYAYSYGQELSQLYLVKLA